MTHLYSVVSNKRAYSITSIMIGMALMGIIAIVAAQLATSSKTAEISSTIQGDIDRSHALQMQKLANKKRMLQALGLVTYDTSNPDVSKWTEISYSSKYHCLSFAAKAKGIDCSTFNNIATPVTPSDAKVTLGSSSTREAESKLEFIMRCSSKDRCESFELKLSTTPKLNVAGDLMAKRGFQSRVTQVNYSGALITNRAQVSFNCANGTGTEQPFGTSLDLKTLNVSCTPIFEPLTDCTSKRFPPIAASDEPDVLTSLGGPNATGSVSSYCKPKVTIDCSSGTNLGMTTAGLFSADPKCNN